MQSFRVRDAVFTNIDGLEPGRIAESQPREAIGPGREQATLCATHAVGIALGAIRWRRALAWLLEKQLDGR